MPSGSASGWCVRPRRPARTRCTAIGTADWSMRSSRAALVLLAAPALWLAACPAGAAELHPFEAVEPHMGTLVRIKLYAGEAEQAKAAFRAAFARIAELDAAP